MSDEKFEGTGLRADAQGRFHLDLPKDDSDRNMVEAEIAVLAMFLRITQDVEWGSDLLKWFYETHGDRLEVASEEFEGAAV